MPLFVIQRLAVSCSLLRSLSFCLYTLLTKINWPLCNKKIQTIESHKYASLLKVLKLQLFDESLRSDSGYVTCIAVTILCVWKKFHSGTLKLILNHKGTFHQAIIKLYTIYISLTDINIRTVIILSSTHFPSIHTTKNSSDESLWYV